MAATGARSSIHPAGCLSFGEFQDLTVSLLKAREILFQQAPIIDIAIAAQHHTLADEWQNAMASLGYDYPGDIGLPGDRIYGRDCDIRRFLAHVVDANGLQWSRYIYFRDRLRANSELAKDYEALKLDAAAKYPTGRSSYTHAKSSFIEKVLGRV